MAKNSDQKNDDKRYFTFQEDQDEYALMNYGLKVKNRAAKKQTRKFSDKNERDYYDY